MIDGRATFDPVISPASALDHVLWSYKIPVATAPYVGKASMGLED